MTEYKKDTAKAIPISIRQSRLIILENLATENFDTDRSKIVNALIVFLDKHKNEKEIKEEVITILNEL